MTYIKQAVDIDLYMTCVKWVVFFDLSIRDRHTAVSLMRHSREGVLLPGTTLLCIENAMTC